MRIKEIEARLAAIKQEIEQRGDAMTAAEIDALEQETTQLTEERAAKPRPTIPSVRPNIVPRG